MISTKGKVILGITSAIILVGGGIVVYQIFIKPKSGNNSSGNDNPKNNASTGGGTNTSTGSGTKPTIPDPVLIPKTIKEGSTLVATRTTPGGTAAWLTTTYKDGGSDGKGNIESGKYAGVVTQIDNSAQSVKVTNYRNAMFGGGKPVYEFWLKKSDVKAA